MRGPFVVVGPRIRGAERERAAGDDDVAARLDLRRAPRLRPRQARERQRLRHRLGVLELVLDDHADDEFVERRFGEACEHRLAHVPEVGACGLRRQDRQPAALVACVGGRVVEVVVLRRDRVPSAVPTQEPELLEVADMGQIPDEGRLERRDLARELLVRERLQQSVRSPPRALEGEGELRL